MKKKINFDLRKIGITALLITTLVVVFIWQYLFCVPVNIHSAGFLVELIILLGLLFMIMLPSKDNTVAKKLRLYYVPLIAAVVLFLAMFIGAPYTGGLNNYRNQSVIRDVDFATIPEFDKTQIQLVDKNTAQQLGDRVFGTLGSDEVSQYQIGDDWVQISKNGTLYRVTPIDFGGLFKYFATGSTPGYLTVDCETGDAKLVRSEGMKYLKSAYFGKNIYRHLFFHDPTAIMASVKFELDDNNDPYWIAPVMDVTWIGKTEDVKGVYIVDPVSGNIDYYDKDDVPSWVDNVYPISTVYRQFSQSKRYENGLFNWAKKGVVEFTDDYAYVQFNDNVWIYTGVTSVGKDESNVGFAYVDLRNGEISYIRRAGAEEYSARSSAEGAVQQYHYSAIFPSMVNVRSVPTYFMGLVDGANLIKNYAFVSYENYQLVATGTTVEEAYRNYVKLINGDQPVEPVEIETSIVSFTVSDVMTIVQNGNSVVLLKDENGKIYSYDLSGGDFASVFTNVGEIVTVMADENGTITGFIR